MVSEAAVVAGKKRKRYALGGCLITVFFSTHAVLLWRRRNEFRTLNKILPPIGWEKFASDYLAQGRVSVCLPPLAIFLIYGSSLLGPDRRDRAIGAVLNYVCAPSSIFSFISVLNFLAVLCSGFFQKTAKKISDHSFSFATSGWLFNVDSTQISFVFPGRLKCSPTSWKFLSSYVYLFTSPPSSQKRNY